MDKVAKAIVGAATALGGTVVTATSDGVVTPVEYVLIVVATVVAYFGVWSTTNAPPDKS